MKALLYTPTIVGPKISEVECDGTLHHIGRLVGSDAVTAVYVGESGNRHCGWISKNDTSSGESVFLTRFNGTSRAIAGPALFTHTTDHSPLTCCADALADLITKIDLAVPEF